MGKHGRRSMRLAGFACLARLRAHPPLYPLPKNGGEELDNWAPRPKRLGKRPLVEIVELSTDRKTVC